MWVEWVPELGDCYCASWREVVAFFLSSSSTPNNIETQMPGTNTQWVVTRLLLLLLKPSLSVRE